MSNIYVTKTFLPPLEEYQAVLEEIWRSRQVTNNGPFSNKLEAELASYLEIPHLKWLSNGTTALQIALKSLELKGEILTTPFTYVATANSIIWEQCTPVFVDIDPLELNMDPQLVQEKINDRTVGVLAVHVYGYPCRVHALSDICRKYDLPLIFDAAHAFGVRYQGRSLAEYGDLSVFSFHATKVYHTIEGGAIACHDESMAKKIELFKTFGHEYDEYIQVGINGKNTELHAAIGLLNLKYFPELVAQRKLRFELYHEQLQDAPVRLLHPSDHEGLEYNYGYMVVIFQEESTLLNVAESLKRKNIYPRRYFMPSLNTLEYLNISSCPNAESISGRVLCLPLYHDLEEATIRQICQLIKAEL